MAAPLGPSEHWAPPDTGPMGAALEGRRVAVYYHGEAQYFEAVVRRYHAETDTFTVEYESDPGLFFVETLGDDYHVYVGPEPAPGRKLIVPGPGASVPSTAQAPGQAAESALDQQKKGKAKGNRTYADMCMDAISNLGATHGGRAARDGFTLPAIRKSLMSVCPEVKQKQRASFNSLTLKAMQRLIAQSVLEKNGSQYRFHPDYIDRIKRAEAAALSFEKGKGGDGRLKGQGLKVMTPRRRGRDYRDGRAREHAAYLSLRQAERQKAVKMNESLNQAWNSHNRALRQEMEEKKMKRDDFMEERIAILTPFLPEDDNYFLQKERRMMMEAWKTSTRSPGTGRAAGPKGHRQQGNAFFTATTTPIEVVKLLIRAGLLPPDAYVDEYGICPYTIIGHVASPPDAHPTLHEESNPPLLLDPDSGEVLGEKEALGYELTEEDGGDELASYKVVWPGIRFEENALPKAVAPGVITWKHLYFLERAGARPSEVDRVTAMRLQAGTFVVPAPALIKDACSYAKKGNTPADNLVRVSYVDPRTSKIRLITRQFCPQDHYDKMWKRTLQDIVRRRPSLQSALNGQALPEPKPRPSARSPVWGEEELRPLEKASLPLKRQMRKDWFHEALNPYANFSMTFAVDALDWLDRLVNKGDALHINTEIMKRTREVQERLRTWLLLHYRNPTTADRVSSRRQFEVKDYARSKKVVTRAQTSRSRRNSTTQSTGDAAADQEVDGNQDGAGNRVHLGEAGDTGGNSQQLNLPVAPQMLNELQGALIRLNAGESEGGPASQQLAGPDDIGPEERQAVPSADKTNAATEEDAVLGAAQGTAPNENRQDGSTNLEAVSLFKEQAPLREILLDNGASLQPNLASQSLAAAEAPPREADEITVSQSYGSLTSLESTRDSVQRGESIDGASLAQVSSSGSLAEDETGGEMKADAVPQLDPALEKKLVHHSDHPSTGIIRMLMDSDENLQQARREAKQAWNRLTLQRSLLMRFALQRDIRASKLRSIRKRLETLRRDLAAHMRDVAKKERQRRRELEAKASVERPEERQSEVQAERDVPSSHPRDAQHQAVDPTGSRMSGGYAPQGMTRQAPSPVMRHGNPHQHGMMPIQMGCASLQPVGLPPSAVPGMPMHAGLPAHGQMAHHGIAVHGSNQHGMLHAGVPDGTNMNQMGYHQMPMQSVSIAPVGIHAHGFQPGRLPASGYPQMSAHPGYPHPHMQSQMMQHPHPTPQGVASQGRMQPAGLMHPNYPGATIAHSRMNPLPDQHTARQQHMVHPGSLQPSAAPETGPNPDAAASAWMSGPGGHRHAHASLEDRSASAQSYPGDGRDQLPAATPKAKPREAKKRDKGAKSSGADPQRSRMTAEIQKLEALREALEKQTAPDTWSGRVPANDPNLADSFDIAVADAIESCREEIPNVMDKCENLYNLTEKAWIDAINILKTAREDVEDLRREKVRELLSGLGEQIVDLDPEPMMSTSSSAGMELGGAPLLGQDRVEDAGVARIPDSVITPGATAGYLSTIGVVKEAEERSVAEAAGSASAGDGDAPAARSIKIGTRSSSNSLNGLTIDGTKASASAPRSSSDFETVEPSTTVRATLHKHQITGLSWLVHMYKCGVNSILGDQMGLGKTLQTIAFIAYLRDTLKASGPHLIVVPLSVLSNWLQEMDRFCPSMRCVRFHGPRDERQRIKDEELSNLDDFDVVITTFEMLTSDSNFFRRRFVWRTVTVDEGHRLKNEKSQLSERLRKVPSVFKLLLTGTPLQNNLRELWALLHYLFHDIFPAASTERFTDGFDAVRNVCDPQRLRAARRLLSVIMLRRLKDDVEIPLPPKKELQVLVPLTAQQHELYKRILTDIDDATLESVLTEDSSDGKGIEEKKQEPSVGVDYKKLMNLLLQLRKICNHCNLMLEDSNRFGGSSVEDLIAGSGKLSMLDRMLPRLREDGHRVLIFSQFTSMLDILEEYCMARKHEFARLDGETNRVQRRLDIRRFNAAGSPLFLYLISTRAGGLGINLATADTVILYDSDWNPQVDLQAMERAHRIGQTKPVTIFRFVCRGSVEERMVSRAEKKLYLNAMVAENVQEGGGAEEDAIDRSKADSVASSMGELASQGLDKSELKAMIRFGANAVIETQNHDISDADLDVLLGRKANSEVGDDGKGPVLSRTKAEEAEDDEKDTISLVMLKKRLKERDVRSLNGVKYEKRSDGALEDSLILFGQRKRKQRIQMVDGSGTGYGAAVPVLASFVQHEEESEARAAKAAALREANKKQRVWQHQTRCLWCHGPSPPGEMPMPLESEPLESSRKASTESLDDGDQAPTYPAPLSGPCDVKCTFCPRVYHDECLKAFVATRLRDAGAAAQSSTPVVCPQHKCTSCFRTTAAAGGLLFRCISCPIALCEDCLPEEEIEGLGRSAYMEQTGYHGKQSYWIKCNSCLAAGREPAIEPERKEPEPVVIEEPVARVEDDEEGLEDLEEVPASPESPGKDGKKAKAKASPSNKERKKQKKAAMADRGSDGKDDVQTQSTAQKGENPQRAPQRRERSSSTGKESTQPKASKPSKPSKKRKTSSVMPNPKKSKVRPTKRAKTSSSISTSDAPPAVVEESAAIPEEMDMVACLDDLCNADAAFMFVEPSAKSGRGDLTTLRIRLETRGYRNAECFIREVRRLWTPVLSKPERHEEPLVKGARELRTLFENGLSSGRW